MIDMINNPLRCQICGSSNGDFEPVFTGTIDDEDGMELFFWCLDCQKEGIESTTFYPFSRLTD